MRAGFQALEMESTALIGDGIATIFEINTYVCETLVLRKRFLTAITFEDTTNDRARAAEQVLGQAN